MRPLVKYLKNQFLLNKIDIAYLENLVTLGKITSTERDLIIYD